MRKPPQRAAKALQCRRLVVGLLASQLPTVRSLKVYGIRTHPPSPLRFLRNLKEQGG